MDKLFIIQFACKNLLNHRLRTTLTLIGIVIGISAIVFLVSFAFGIEKLVTQEVTGGDAFKLVDVGTGNSQIVRLSKDALGDIKKLSNAQDVQTTINVASKAKDGENTMDVAFFATSPLYMGWSGLKTRWGNQLSADSRGELVVNTNYLSLLKISSPEEAIGKTVFFDITLPKELLGSDEDKILNNQEFKIIGVIKSDSGASVYSTDNSLLASGIINYSQAKVEINNRDNVAELRKQIESMGFRTQYVGDTVAQIEQIFNVFKIILGSFGLIALIVASLGMFNTLTISLLERMKEVALLKILGTRRRDIGRLFLTEALMFGAIGGTLGIALGVAAGQIANYVLNVFASRSGADRINVFYYPLWFILSVVAFSLLVGFITGLYPSNRAAKVSSLDVIRYE